LIETSVFQRYEVEKLIFLQSVILRLSMAKGTTNYEYGIEACFSSL